MPTADILALASGGLVGLTLGLIGGGGSILAVPLLVYVVGVSSAHIAIGTSAVAVAVNAAIGAIFHARANTIKWPCAIVFAISGIAGALIGAMAGQMVDGDVLLTLFGLLMIAIGLSMLWRRGDGGDPSVHLDLSTARQLLPSLVGYGLGVGLLSGFFGIGGGFLIVPGLIGATNMPILFAVGSSLVSVSAFGSATAFSYALSDFVDWKIAMLMLAGGAVGAFFGAILSRRLAANKQMLARVFAFIVMGVGIYVSVRGVMTL
ncbi:MAG: sulfite exporter TauE/SafE family protein [Pseudomonadota bacterium]